MKLIFLIPFLLFGCATYAPQKIRYCADYYLYTEKSKLDAALHNYSGGIKKDAGGFYGIKDNSIHVMKWINPYTLLLTINMEPVYGIILALFILGDKEYMSPSFYYGAIIILITVLANGIIKAKSMTKNH